MPDTGYISGIWRFLRYLVSSRIVLCYPAGYRIFQSSGKLRGVDSVKINFTFSIYVKKFGASLTTLILCGLSTKSRTESKP